MNVELEKILGTLEVITEVPISLRLPDLVSFVWDVTRKGEFNFISLGVSEGWITSTDIEVAVEGWQAVEQRGYLNEEYDDRSYFEDEGIYFITPEVADERAKIYQLLTKNIQESLHNIEILKFSLNSDYSFFAVLGETQDNIWFALSETVAREIELKNEIKTSPSSDLIVDNNFNSHALNLKNEFQKIIDQLEPISIFGYYGSGYDYRFNHHLVQGMASSKEKALSIALNQAGMLNMAYFHEFNISSIDFIELQYDKDEMAEITQKYQKINNLLKQNLSDLKMIRCSFWNYDQIYIIGQTISKDFVGVSMENEFDYNP